MTKVAAEVQSLQQQTLKTIIEDNLRRTGRNQLEEELPDYAQI